MVMLNSPIFIKIYAFNSALEKKVKSLNETWIKKYYLLIIINVIVRLWKKCVVLAFLYELYLYIYVVILKFLNSWGY